MSSSDSAVPVLLALDTATDRIHAALSVGGQVHALDLPGGAQASATLLPALNGLLAEAGRVWADVDAIAFGRGPGAFTGLRTACSVTQGLALALNKPVIALDTLMAVAEHARLASPSSWAEGDTLWVLQDARMDELYVAAYRWDGHDWQQDQAPALWPLTEPAHRWAATGGQQATLRWAGNALKVYPVQLSVLNDMAVAVATVAAPGSIPVCAAEPAVPGGAALAALAQRAWQRGQTLDAALALPLYVRDKVAQTTAERVAVKAALSGGTLGTISGA
ncbi:MAG: tRNA (adenosine(37)-N6)-threonylcarbamoyltransferase complex dimerization subunit type 1 TsaB [Aquabacterium sp.]|uniref:tRNA (adenosine(37)-N6)-threonylcarbamoyltransferase complex dimerization subunit type 1 TsaB n=1 Tax=Aquabacterium sp. TaxID=1872578 RepID=UPI0025BE245B|nr:tRNA (adenosine(37)-N6)-threonylcarbamoyltransferase complex dimerization subunit type 1 TsaB [Aquabacterium sp.]MBI5927529.1 tRNA (adenosine(37)-N6)-threonylcarbamoyltransferase complex dimerization subunit type 1 TsaB [Aquabacterium sp.]